MMNGSKINQVCQGAHRYFQREEFGQVARMMAEAMDKNPQSPQLQINYALALFMLGYLDYAWKVSCYGVAQLSNVEAHPWTEKLFDKMSDFFFVIAHSERSKMP